MLKYILVLVVSLGFITPAFAGIAPPPLGEGQCFVNDDCTESALCEQPGTCVGAIGNPDRGIPGECVYECTATFKSRGDCISTETPRCQLSFPKGQDRKNCEAIIKDFCDCAVDQGCTDLPTGPPDSN